MRQPTPSDRGGQKENLTFCHLLPIMPAMNAREKEAMFIDRILDVIKAGDVATAASVDEANVFNITALLLPKFHSLSDTLFYVSDKYFIEHEIKPIGCSTAVRSGLIIDVPRFQNMVIHALRENNLIA